MKSFLLFLLSFVLVLNYYLFPQSFYYGIDFDTVKAQKFDMGKMWTFENPPLDYFETTYGFRPSLEWLDQVQKAALKFGGGCSASFISEDGLIMTNHHCIRGRIPDFQKDGEDLLANGFYAETLEQERKVPGLYVEQLLLIEDVTDQIKAAMNEADVDSAKIDNRDKKIEEIKKLNAEKNPALMYKVMSLYNGGKYSLYGYKRYDDIRVVFLPELQIAHLGGDYDNFTYPRYCLDFAFLRAYDNNGKPVKCNYYFNWSTEPVYESQLLFVVGNPGSTDRINTIAQLEFEREYRYKNQTRMRQDLYNVYEELVNETNAQDMQLISRMYSVGNGLKVYEETFKSLCDPYLMARKKDFEKNFKNAVQSDPTLNQQYGKIWDEIAASRKEASNYAKEIFAYNISASYSPSYLFAAQKLVKLARQLKLPEEEREVNYRNEKLDSTIQKIYPADFDKKFEDKKLLVQVNVLVDNLGSDNSIIREMLQGREGKEAVEYLLSRTKLSTNESVIALCKSGSDAILNSDDPFIIFVLKTQDKLDSLKAINKKLDDKDEINNQLLGEALYKVYGNEYPPDATGTLRISDGLVKGYEYNGTIAPVKTTFYGSLDRYFSFEKKFPFNLPTRWQNLPEEVDLSTTMDFISTNDIIGGNSGSPVIDIDAEVVGLAFDGNIESHSGRFIYTTEANRTVNVSAGGIIEAVRDLYKAERLASEILEGKID